MYTSLIQKIDRDIAAQLKTLGVGEKTHPKLQFPTITISREFGCEGIPVAQALVRKLSTKEYPWVIFHRELIAELSGKSELQKDLIESINTLSRGMIHQYIEHLLAHKPTNVQLYRKMAEAMRILAMNGRSILLGSGGAILTSDIKNALHIRLQANLEFKTERVCQLLEVSRAEAIEQIRTNDINREEFIYEFTRKDVREPHHYHLVIDNSVFNAEQIAELVHHSLKMRNMLPEI